MNKKTYVLIIFVVAIIRSFLPPEKIRSILSHKNEYIGNILAAGNRRLACEKKYRLKIILKRSAQILVFTHIHS